MDVVSILLLRRLKKQGSMLCYSTRSLERHVTLLPAAGPRKHDRLLTGTSQPRCTGGWRGAKMPPLLNTSQHLPQTRWIQLKFVQVQLHSFPCFKRYCIDKQLTRVSGDKSYPLTFNSYINIRDGWKNRFSSELWFFCVSFFKLFITFLILMHWSISQWPGIGCFSTWSAIHR